MNTKDHELMARMKISKAVAAMAIPSVISSLVTVVYNMADTFFVGQTRDPLQVAAVSLTNPIFILFMAVANMFGMGGSAVASIALGGQDQKRMRQVSAFITYASLVVGVLFAGALLVFMQPILTLFGVNEETYAFAKGYVFYISYGAPFIIWSAAASFVVRAEGASREAMIGSMIGTVANSSGSGTDQWISSGSGRSRGGHDAGQYSGKHLLPLVFYKEEQQFFYFFKVFYL